MVQQLVRDAIVGNVGKMNTHLHPFTSDQLDVVLAHGSQRLISQWLPQILQSMQVSL